MRVKRAVIDSLNLSSYDVEKMFDSKDYIIEPVKSIGVFEPKRWSETFGKPLAKKKNGKWVTPIKEAKILHTYTGLTIPLKRFISNQQMQTIEFAGLHGYNERSKWLTMLLRDKWSQLQDTRLMRVDVAIDYKGNIPRRVTKKLLENRIPFKWKNTRYHKTEKEGKTNSYIDIKIYDKAKKENLDYPLERLEFVFKGAYFNKLKLNSLDEVIKKMEKSIKKATGVNVRIDTFLTRVS